MNNRNKKKIIANTYDECCWLWGYRVDMMRLWREWECYEINLINITTINFFHRNSSISGHTRANTHSHTHTIALKNNFINFSRATTIQSMILCMQNILHFLPLFLSLSLAPTPPTRSMFSYSIRTNLISAKRIYVAIHCALSAFKIV